MPILFAQMWWEDPNWWQVITELLVFGAIIGIAFWEGRRLQRQLAQQAAQQQRQQIAHAEQIEQQTKSQMDEFMWRRMVLAAEFAGQWEARTKRLRELIEPQHGPFRRCPELKPANAELFAKATSGNYAAYKYAVIELMNWFDDIAICYNRKMLDREIIDKAVRPPLCAWYELIYPMVEAINVHYPRQIPGSIGIVLARVLKNVQKVEKERATARNQEGEIPR